MVSVVSAGEAAGDFLEEEEDGFVFFAGLA